MGNLAMDKLERTLRELGIEDTASLGIRTYLASPADAEKNKQLYKQVNENYLLSILEERNPGECVHITGEMRALADRSHRLICRKTREKYNNRWTLVCSLPIMDKYKQRGRHFHRTIGREILKWMQYDWKDASLMWIDYLDIFDLLGDNEVIIYTSPKPERIHYSTFANEYILLQAYHSVGKHVKEVWLLNSRKLFEILSEKTKEIISRSEPLPPRIFKNVTLSISSSNALHILFLLNENKEISTKDLLHQVKDEEAFQDPCTSLEAVGFIETIGDFSHITEQGKEYLSLFSE